MRIIKNFAGNHVGSLSESLLRAIGYDDVHRLTEILSDGVGKKAYAQGAILDVCSCGMGEFQERRSVWNDGAQMN